MSQPTTSSSLPSSNTPTSSQETSPSQSAPLPPRINMLAPPSTTTAPPSPASDSIVASCVPTVAVVEPTPVAPAAPAVVVFAAATSTSESIPAATSAAADAAPAQPAGDVAPVVEEEIHPLQHSWTLYYDNTMTNKAKEADKWSNALVPIYEFSTVEDFWRVFHNIAKPHELTNGSNYHLFKDKVKPAWEDPQNLGGGRWIFSPAPVELDDSFLDSILAMIGEQFDDPQNDLISGIDLNIRNKGNRLALWIRPCQEDGILSVGRKWKELGGFHTPIQYQPHNEAMKRGSYGSKLSV